MNRPTRDLRAVLLIAFVLTLLSGCLEFESIEQPSSALPGDVFTVRITATATSTDLGGTQPYFGVCLPRGWIIPGDAFSYTGVCQGTIRYDPNLSREQENLGPAPEGYFWWVGSGDYAETMGGAVSAEVPIQTGLQTGRYSLSYLLAVAPYDGGGGLSDAQRSANYIVGIVNGFTPRELKASVRGNSVVLTWLPPRQSEGLTGYRVYRDGQSIDAGPAEITEALDKDLAGGVFCYAVSALYADADEQHTPYEVKALVFSGGTGEPNDPYLVEHADQLVSLADELNLVSAEDPNLSGKAFLLVNDLDLDPRRWGKTAFRQAVIGTFSGIFDGGGHVISHLTIQGGRNLGLFGYSTGEVRDIGVVEVNITGSPDSVGGLVGANYGSITACYSNGFIRGLDSVGGLVGHNAGQIADTYSSGSVSGTTSVGGLVGNNLGEITNSYSRGSVRGSENVGGLVGRGQQDGAITCFWDIETSGQATSAAGTGKTTTEMRAAGTFLAWGACAPSWTIEEGREYPHLAWEHMPGEAIVGPRYGGGVGSVEAPYRIYTAEHLTTLGLVPCDGSKHFKLMTDVDLSGRMWTGAVIPSFSGVLDGGGRVISGLTITGTGHLGLFGQLRPGADVRRLRLVDVNIVGSDDFIGGLVGAKEGGTVTQCSSTGTVYGQGDCVGGLVGSNRGPVTQCCSAGTGRGKNCVGGLVGYTHEGTIQDCYSTASSAGQDDVGGLVGYRLAGRIMKCYAAGHVVGHRNVAGLLGMSVGGTYGDPVLDCFWDAETSAQERVVPWSGTGKTTAEMRTAKTFLDAGWDFVGETANGMEDLWRILESEDYPRLWWEAEN